VTIKPFEKKHTHTHTRNLKGSNSTTNVYFPLQVLCLLELIEKKERVFPTICPHTRTHTLAHIHTHLTVVRSVDGIERECAEKTVKIEPPFRRENFARLLQKLCVHIHACVDVCACVYVCLCVRDTGLYIF